MCLQSGQLAENISIVWCRESHQANECVLISPEGHAESYPECELRMAEHILVFSIFIAYVHSYSYLRKKEDTSCPINPRITNPIPARLIQGCLVLITFSR